MIHCSHLYVTRCNGRQDCIREGTTGIWRCVWKLLSSHAVSLICARPLVTAPTITFCCSISALQFSIHTMRYTVMVPSPSLVASLLLGLFFQTIFSAPITNPVGPPGASGSLYGPEAFLGADGNPVSPTDSAVVPTSSYDLVAGQSADTDYGFYLDFDSTANPQPIRGSQGGTDPGPRE